MSRLSLEERPILTAGRARAHAYNLFYIQFYCQIFHIVINVLFFLIVTVGNVSRRFSCSFHKQLGHIILPKTPTNGTGSGLYSVDLTQHSTLMLKPLHRHTPHLQKQQYIHTLWSNAERRTVPYVLLRCFRLKGPLHFREAFAARLNECWNEI